MKYLRLFKNGDNFSDFINGENYVTPNVCFIEDEENMNFSEQIISLCDVAYWDGSMVNTIPCDLYEQNMGTPIGIVVIPGNMLPDKKARILALTNVGNNGIPSNDYTLYYAPSTINGLGNYTNVPTTDNAGSTTNGFNAMGYLPSDNFTGATSYVDYKSKYKGSTPFIPSPYLHDDKTLNNDYLKSYAATNENGTYAGEYNALLDLNGKKNTEFLVSLNLDCKAAIACHNYNDGVSNLQWYLPAMGELGFLMPRLKEINNTLQKLSKTQITGSLSFWSSTAGYSNAFYLNITNGNVSKNVHNRTYYVRPFAILE